MSVPNIGRTSKKLENLCRSPVHSYDYTLLFPVEHRLRSQTNISGVDPKSFVPDYQRVLSNPDNAGFHKSIHQCVAFSKVCVDSTYDTKSLPLRELNSHLRHGEAGTLHEGCGECELIYADRTESATSVGGIPFVLGSTSSIRKAILERIGIKQFRTLTCSIDEKAAGEPFRQNCDPAVYVLAVARKKASALIDLMRSGDHLGTETDTYPTLVLTTDQVVVYNNKIREKPASIEEARQMVTDYSENACSTVGAAVLTEAHTGWSVAGISRSTVNFTQIPQENIERFVHAGECFHCAGALLIESSDMDDRICKIDGTIDSTQGLSVFLLGQLIEKLFLHLRDGAPSA